MSKILILYHSGVGGTKLVARLIQAALSSRAETRLFSVEELDDLAILDDYDHLVIGFPTYHCDPSPSIQAFIERLPMNTTPKKMFAFTTCGLYSANTLRIFARQCLMSGKEPRHRTFKLVPLPCLGWFPTRTWAEIRLPFREVPGGEGGGRCGRRPGRL